ncbi:MAG: propionyl-CoA synthetase [Aestuariivirga sp.]|uniref:propionyl-CoA synthetase n=1 Tax=Aestuariivirga sp. TaxID=2650926 RepID=UPI0025BF9F5E|nr:propionyl-CoA synthetase [Aestuariivirga sp.]MCA3561228.1 propionyl-CoA synthetase [Aestuariivirga sp.]
MSRYHETYAAWKQDPAGFWAEAAKGIDWETPWTDVYAKVEGLDRWFVGAELNTCWNAVDRHVKAGHGGRLAVIYDSPVTGAKAQYTYNQLLDEVATLAAALEDLGVRKGDRVILYMPMIPQALFAMLACARLGAVHSVVFGGFAPPELATRINDAKPRAIMTASCGIEPNRVIPYKPLLDQALDIAAHKVEACVVFQRGQVAAELKTGRDHDWDGICRVARGFGRKAGCVPVKATDPLYILYTSGTTGQPKGVVRDNGGHAVAMKWSMDNIYNIKPGEVFWAASDVGWVVGHSYIVYAPLIQGAATIVFEGKPVGTPDAGAFWRVIAEYRVSALFTAPTAFRAIRKEDPEGHFIRKYDLTAFRTLFLAGERADPETVKWAEEMLKVPVIDHWWQTETGWTIAGNPVGLGMLPVKHGSPSVAMPGYDIRVLDEGGHEVPRGKLGAICVKLPLPPSCLPTLWNNDGRFRKSYLSHFPGYYETADAGYMDEDGYLYIMARTDDIINVAGHRLSTGGMEEVLAGHPNVAETAVIGIADPLKGQVPVGFVVLKSGVARPAAEIEAECVTRIRDKIGAVAALKTVVVVPRLPKTRSGKILRATMRKIAGREEFKTPATIDDPAILDEIRAALASKGIGV